MNEIESPIKKKMRDKYPKVLKLRGDRKNTPPSLKEKPIRVRNLKDAKKLIGRLLVAFQREEIDGRNAKDLAYLLTVFIQIVKDVELDERLTKLENNINNQRGL